MKYTYEILLLQSLGCLKHLSLEMFDFFCAFAKENGALALFSRRNGPQVKSLCM